MASIVRIQRAVMLALLLSLVMAREVYSVRRQMSRRIRWLRGTGPVDTSYDRNLSQHGRRLQTDEDPSDDQDAQAPTSPEQDNDATCPKSYTVDGLPEGGSFSGDNAVTYWYPQDSLGYLVDFCARPGSDCGKIAADAFCEGEGFTYALLFVKDSGAGFRCRPTRYINDPGLFCSCSEREGCICDGFEFITCVQQL